MFEDIDSILGSLGSEYGGGAAPTDPLADLATEYGPVPNDPPPAKPKKSLRGLTDFAKKRKFTITSTTGGQHNKNSRHYRRQAIDVRTRDKTDAEIQAFIKEAAAAGYRVRDERARPAGQKVWGGPHLHLDFDDLPSAPKGKSTIPIGPANDPVATLTSGSSDDLPLYPNRRGPGDPSLYPQRLGQMAQDQAQGMLEQAGQGTIQAASGDKPEIDSQGLLRLPQKPAAQQPMKLDGPEAAQAAYQEFLRQTGLKPGLDSLKEFNTVQQTLGKMGLPTKEEAQAWLDAPAQPQPGRLAADAQGLLRPEGGQPGPKDFKTRFAFSGDVIRDKDEFASRVANSTGLNYNTVRQYLDQRGLQGNDGGMFSPEVSARWKGRETNWVLSADEIRQLKDFQREQSQKLTKANLDYKQRAAGVNRSDFKDQADYETELAMQRAIADMNSGVISYEEASKIFNATKQDLEAWKSENPQSATGAYSKRELQAYLQQQAGGGAQNSTAEIEPFLQKIRGRADKTREEAIKEYGSLRDWREAQERLYNTYQGKPFLQIAKSFEAAAGGGMKAVVDASGRLLQATAIAREGLVRAALTPASLITGKDIATSQGDKVEATKQAEYKLGTDIVNLANSIPIPEGWKGGNSELIGNAVAQVILQAGVGLPTGGVGSFVLGGAQGGAAAYEEVKKFEAEHPELGKNPWRALGAATAAGLLAVPDIFILSGDKFTPFFKSVRWGLSQQLVKRGLAKPLAEKAAVEAADGLFDELIKKGGFKAIAGQAGKGLKTGVLESGQEVGENVGNDAYAYLVYDPSPERFQKMTNLLSKENVASAIGGFFGGLAGGSIAEIQTRAAGLRTAEEVKEVMDWLRLREIKSVLGVAMVRRVNTVLSKRLQTLQPIGGTKAAQIGQPAKQEADELLDDMEFVDVDREDGNPPAPPAPPAAAANLKFKRDDQVVHKAADGQTREAKIIDVDDKRAFIEFPATGKGKKKTPAQVQVVPISEIQPKDFEILGETGPQATSAVGKLKEQRDLGRREAETDPLTGVANRRALDRALPSAEKDPNTAVIAFDANNFGKINKTKGEAAGDTALKDITLALRFAAAELGGRVFRKGGDEFVILAPKANAEAIRDKAEQTFGTKKFDDFEVSISGVVGDTFTDADAILQQRKAERKAAAPVSGNAGPTLETQAAPGTPTTQTNVEEPTSSRSPKWTMPVAWPPGAENWTDEQVDNYLNTVQVPTVAYQGQSLREGEGGPEQRAAFTIATISKNWGLPLPEAQAAVLKVFEPGLENDPEAQAIRAINVKDIQVLEDWPGEVDEGPQLAMADDEPRYVPITQEDKNYTYHSTDRIENLEGILRDGLRPGHASNVRGQGVDQPYVLVYEGNQPGLKAVPHRPGDMMGSVSGKPKAIIVDDEQFADQPPIEELLAALEGTYDQLEPLYEKLEAGTITPEEEALRKRLERRSDYEEREYFDALDRDKIGDYKAQNSDTILAEARALGAKYGIPVIRGMRTDEDPDTLQIPAGSLSQDEGPQMAAGGTPSSSPLLRSIAARREESDGLDAAGIASRFGMDLADIEAVPPIGAAGDFGWIKYGMSQFLLDPQNEGLLEETAAALLGEDDLVFQMIGGDYKDRRAVMTAILDVMARQQGLERSSQLTLEQWDKAILFNAADLPAEVVEAMITAAASTAQWHKNMIGFLEDPELKKLIHMVDQGQPLDLKKIIQIGRKYDQRSPWGEELSPRVNEKLSDEVITRTFARGVSGRLPSDPVRRSSQRAGRRYDPRKQEDEGSPQLAGAEDEDFADKLDRFYDPHEGTPFDQWSMQPENFNIKAEDPLEYVSDEYVPHKIEGLRFEGKLPDEYLAAGDQAMWMALRDVTAEMRRLQVDTPTTRMGPLTLEAVETVAARYAAEQDQWPDSSDVRLGIQDRLDALGRLAEAVPAGKGQFQVVTHKRRVRDYPPFRAGDYNQQYDEISIHLDRPTGGTEIDDVQFAGAEDGEARPSAYVQLVNPVGPGQRVSDPNVRSMGDLDPRGYGTYLYTSADSLRATVANELGLVSPKLAPMRTGVQQVEIAAPIDSFLHWDKPLWKQSEIVINGLKQDARLWNWISKLDKATGKELTGGEIYDVVMRYMRQTLFDMNAVKGIEKEALNHMIQKSASDWLVDRGIRGTRYYDPLHEGEGEDIDDIRASIARERKRVRDYLDQAEQYKENDQIDKEVAARASAKVFHTHMKLLEDRLKAAQKNPKLNNYVVFNAADIRVKETFEEEWPGDQGGPQLAIADDDFDLIPYDVVQTSEGETVAMEMKEGKVSTDTKVLLQLLGEHMYKADLVDTVIKETMQNSLDAVREAKERGLITDPKISLHLDPYRRMLTIADNGIGMDYDTVMNAYLRLGGSKKGTVASGGLGMAKAAFLFGSEFVSVTTVKDGTELRFTVTPDKADGTAVEIESRPTTEPNGTTQVIKFPETVSSSIGTRTIELPYNLARSSFFEQPMLGDVEVVTKTGEFFDGQTYEPAPIGKNFPLERDYNKLTHATFSWGEADIYIGKTKRRWGGSHIVLSNGIYQFRDDIKMTQLDSFPYDLIINVRPFRKPTDPDYPFTLNREGWRHTIDPDRAALHEYIANYGRAEQFGEHLDRFSKIRQVPRVTSIAEVARVAEEARAAIQGTKKLEAPKQDDSKNITIRSGQVYREPKPGTGKVAPESFQADMEVVDPSSMMESLGIEHGKPVVHNNTNRDWVAIADEEGVGDASVFFTEMANAVQDLTDFVVELTADKQFQHSIGNLSARAGEIYSGLSIDKEYRGVTISEPFLGVFLNPLAVDKMAEGDPALVAMEFVNTVAHELAHVGPQKGRGNYDHGEQFVLRFHKLLLALAASGKRGYFDQRFKDILDGNWVLWLELRQAYERYDTSNTTESIGRDQLPGDTGEIESPSRAQPESVSREGRPRSGRDLRPDLTGPERAGLDRAVAAATQRAANVEQARRNLLGIRGTPEEIQQARVSARAQIEAFDRSSLPALAGHHQARVENTAMMVSPQGSQIVRRAMEWAFGREYRTLMGAYFQVGQAQQLQEAVAEMRQERLDKGDDITARHLEDLADVLEKAIDPVFGDLVVLADVGADKMAIMKAVEAEEKAHRADFRVRLREALPIGQFASIEGYQKALTTLSRGTYEGETNRYLHNEVIAQIFRPDALEKLGITAAERQQIEDAYMQQLLDAGITPHAIIYSFEGVDSTYAKNFTETARQIKGAQERANAGSLSPPAGSANTPGAIIEGGAASGGMATPALSGGGGGSFDGGGRRPVAGGLDLEEGPQLAIADDELTPDSIKDKIDQWLIEKAPKFIKEGDRVSAAELAANTSRAGMLLAIGPIKTNLFGNTLNVASTQMAHVLAAAADIAAATATGRQERHATGRYPSDLVAGFVNAWKEGIAGERGALHAIRKGVDDPEELARYDMESITPEAEGQGLAQLEEMPTALKPLFIATRIFTEGVKRTFIAVDRPFSAFERGAERHALARQAAKKAYKDGVVDDWKAEMRRLAKDPTRMIEDLAERAGQFATFQNRNLVTKQIENIRSAAMTGKTSSTKDTAEERRLTKIVGQVLYVAAATQVPFLRTATNVGIRTMEHDPIIGSLKGAFQLRRVGQSSDRAHDLETLEKLWRAQDKKIKAARKAEDSATNKPLSERLKEIEKSLKKSQAARKASDAKIRASDWSSVKKLEALSRNEEAAAAAELKAERLREEARKKHKGVSDQVKAQRKTEDKQRKAEREADYAEREAFHTKREYKEAFDIIGRAGLGALVLLPFMYGWIDGIIQAIGNIDYEEEQKAWEDSRKAGIPEESIKIPGAEYRAPMHLLPLTKMLSVYTTAVEQHRRGGISSAGKGVFKQALTLNPITDPTFRDDGFLSTENLGRTTMNLVPGLNMGILREAGEVLDDQPRSTRGQGFAGPFMRQIPPGLGIGRENLPVSKHPLGGMKGRGGMSRRLGRLFLEPPRGSFEMRPQSTIKRKPVKPKK